MRFFGKIKRKKRNEQQPKQQQQQQQQPSPSRAPSPKAVENRADFNTQNQEVGYRDAQTRQLTLPSPPKSTTGKRLPSRSPSSSSRGEHKKALTTQPPNRPLPTTTQRKQQKLPPPSILHKNTHYGTPYEMLSPPPPQPPTFCHGMPVHGPNNPRVRFHSSGSSGGGDADASVASMSVASVPHMMVGANSIADSSAVSSNGMLNRVMDEEYLRLSAMGMGFEGR